MTTPLMTIADPAQMTECYKGMVRKKGDTGLWGVKYYGPTLEDVLMQHRNDEHCSGDDIRVIQYISITRAIFDSSATQVK